MTQKEKLYKQYLELMNELYRLKGENEKVKELNDEYLNSYNFQHKAQGETLDVWKHEIQWVNSGIDSLKYELKKKAYFETPEGAKYKEQVEAELNELVTRRKAYHSAANITISDIIKTYLGTGWEVGECGRWMRIYYTRGKRTHEFSIDYNPWDGEDNFTMNYPTCGSWDLLHDEGMREYLAGLGKFGSDKDTLRKIMAIMKDYAKNDNELSSLIYKVYDKLKNPEALKND